MLEKVFANLMDNTLMHGGSATEVHTECIISGDELKIIWQDNGTGVSDFEKELIFKRGYGKNTGFGLFLTKEILSITGMSIKETGVFGNGARFEITFPAGGWKTI
ncbi:MAG: HAMP domain-containing sensor histidine kinase [Methanomicrobium sp.]|nr:HAMP domain-containing sensor histidine kinase [Methanomicrobium sp.]